ncbi:MAG TPA: exopolysaccharide biosynthesis polyprenyl glycosylphosphotransferase [Rhizomicrobium sp.]|jgi:exopolysaccharide biosynthesis polyprenyl glycosylphosphotransferase|nr:exopolysaccharide biosynthesis polyprenyl glycosylphosphotransferase [Rhizomicrobium sp.]
MRRVVGQWFAWPSVLLGVVEATLIATICAANFRQLLSVYGTIAPVNSALAALGLTSVIIMLMYSGGLYEKEALTNLRGAIWRSGLITVPVFILAVLATRILATNTDVPIYPHRWEWTLGLTGVWLLLAIFARVLFRSLHRAGYFTQAILLVGSKQAAVELAEIAELGGQYRIAGVVNPDEFPLSAQGLAQIASSTGASRVIVKRDEGNPQMREALTWSPSVGLKVTEYREFYEHEARRVDLAALSNERLDMGREIGCIQNDSILRRGLDVFISVLALLLTAPVLVLTAVGIKCQDGGPIFYSQKRVGLGGRTFTLLKFRSMCVDAEKDGPVWAAERDCRITPVGRIIRKIRIDELPQIINILRGEMSVIGPRPERPYFVEQLSSAIPFYGWRHLVRPGITGWAQVSYRYGASIEDARRKLSYDLYYLKHRSIALDLWILLKTVGVVLRGEGAR